MGPKKNKSNNISIVWILRSKIGGVFCITIFLMSKSVFDWCDVDVLHPRIRGWRTSSVMYLDEIHFIILMSYFQYFAQLCLTLPTLLSPTWTKPREQPLALLLRPLVLVVFGLVLDPGLLWSVPSQPCNGSSMTVLRYVMSEITSSRNSDKNFRKSLLLWLNSDRQRLKYRNGEK